MQGGFRSWNAWVYNNGGEIIDTGKMACRLADGPAVDALQFVQDAIHRHQVAIPRDVLQAEGARNAFMNGLLVETRSARSRGPVVGSLALCSSPCSTRSSACCSIWSSVRTPSARAQTIELLALRHEVRVLRRQVKRTRWRPGIACSWPR